MNRCTKKKSYKEKMIKDMVFAIFTIILVLGIAFFVSETVVSQADGKVTVDEEYYQILEENYVEEIRNYLTESGYENSGINLTVVADEKGNREYCVELHHKRISRLSEEQQNVLLIEIEEMGFQVMGCEFVAYVINA